MYELLLNLLPSRAPPTPAAAAALTKLSGSADDFALVVPPHVDSRAAIESLADELALAGCAPATPWAELFPPPPRSSAAQAPTPAPARGGEKAGDNGGTFAGLVLRLDGRIKKSIVAAARGVNSGGGGSERERGQNSNFGQTGGASNGSHTLAGGLGPIAANALSNAPVVGNANNPHHPDLSHALNPAGLSTPPPRGHASSSSSSTNRATVASGRPILAVSSPAADTLTLPNPSGSNANTGTSSSRTSIGPGSGPRRQTSDRERMKNFLGNIQRKLDHTKTGGRC